MEHGEIKLFDHRDYSIFKHLRLKNKYIILYREYTIIQFHNILVQCMYLSSSTVNELVFVIVITI